MTWSFIGLLLMLIPAFRDGDQIYGVGRLGKYTTYINLKIENIETNTILEKLSFGGLIVVKTLFLIGILWITYPTKIKKYVTFVS